jgi:hypothetical protein
MRKALNALLAEHGHDEELLDTGAFQEATESLAKIERFLASARNQLNIMLKQL